MKATFICVVSQHHGYCTHHLSLDVAYRAFGEWVRSPGELGAEEDRAPEPRDLCPWSLGGDRARGLVREADQEMVPGARTEGPRGTLVPHARCCREVCPHENRGIAGTRRASKAGEQVCLEVVDGLRRTVSADTQPFEGVCCEGSGGFGLERGKPEKGGLGAVVFFRTG